jgi:hypothetical protein
MIRHMKGLRLGTLNIGTLSKIGRLEELIDAMKERKNHYFCLE